MCIRDRVSTQSTGKSVDGMLLLHSGVLLRPSSVSRCRTSHPSPRTTNTHTTPTRSQSVPARPGPTRDSLRSTTSCNLQAWCASPPASSRPRTTATIVRRATKLVTPPPRSILLLAPDGDERQAAISYLLGQGYSPVLPQDPHSMLQAARADGNVIVGFPANEGQAEQLVTATLPGFPEPRKEPAQDEVSSMADGVLKCADKLLQNQALTKTEIATFLVNTPFQQFGEWFMIGNKFEELDKDFSGTIQREQLEVAIREFLLRPAEPPQPRLGRLKIVADMGDDTVAAMVQILERGLGVHVHRAEPVSYTHLRAHETPEHLVCRLLLEKKKKKKKIRKKI
eukprot:TRINITY_DN26711_c0_g1_i2.p1 TRINITY_DN26711_c0_g1~~TRINITY_DN26711_c0_g1_i2.p1  ORF type:complete len:339 (+),score=85.46 TRINITY_DN26711_c0_g1_i2:196-1212(+)